MIIYRAGYERVFIEEYRFVSTDLYQVSLEI